MSEQYKRGLKELLRINPEHGEQSIDELKRISPDFAEYFVSFNAGEIRVREALDDRAKVLIAMTSLVALGHCDGFLQTEIKGARRAGWSREEIIEVMIQCIVYLGFPKALLGLKMAVEVFAKEKPPTSPKSKGNAPRPKSDGTDPKMPKT